MKETRQRVVELERMEAERRRPQDALRASEERYRVLAENVSDGVVVLRERKLVFVNDTLCKMLGYTSAQLLGSKPVLWIRDDYKERFRKTFELLERGVAVKYYLPVPCVKADGCELWAEWRYSFVEWKGRPAILSTIRDRTESKLRELATEEDKRPLRGENIRLRSSIRDHYGLARMVGNSPAMQRVCELVLMVSACDVKVVIYGESGTGKELIAQTIHELSDRRDKAFVPVNCSAIPETLFESECFGYRKGTFTGAYADRPGLFDQARGGTLFLDEVAELTPHMQAKLLRAIEGNGYVPLGDNKVRKADVRVVAATTRNLPDMAKRGLIRQDFFYRIYVVPITVAPLRDRKEDIPLLVDHFLKLHGGGQNRQAIPEKIQKALHNYDWPGNVRELENVVKRYLVTKRLDFIPTHTPDTANFSPEGFPSRGLGLQETIEVFEKGCIARALEKNSWHRAKTAAMLGITERTLYRKLRQYGLGAF